VAGATALHLACHYGVGGPPILATLISPSNLNHSCFCRIRPVCQYRLKLATRQERR
jgi:hypothetical protein